MKETPSITEEDYANIQHDVTVCAMRAAKIVKDDYIDADDLAQDYYVWLLVKQKEHKLNAILFRMIDKIRNYTHWDRRNKKRPMGQVYRVTQNENGNDLFDITPDTHETRTRDFQDIEEFMVLVKKLPITNRQRNIMRLLFVEDYNQREISEILHLSASRISQLTKDCMEVATEHYQKGTTP